MTNPLIWIIDDEWPDYEVEQQLLAASFPACEIRYSKDNYLADLQDFGHQVDGIIAQISVNIDEAMLAQLPKCKGIAVYGAGFERVDIAAARARGIMVTNVQGYCNEDIGDYVMAAIYRSHKRIDAFHGNIKNGLWGAGAVATPIRRLSSQTLAVLGCGAIGRAVAKKALAAGLRVVGYDPYINEEVLHAHGIEKVTLEQALAAGDFISVHINYTPSMDGFLNKEHFAQMKSTAILINAARGRLIHEPDLIAAVQQGSIGGAVLDVIVNEPISMDDALLGVENVTITPHISYISEESFEDLKAIATKNLIAMLQGEKPAHLVNG